VTGAYLRYQSPRSEPHQSISARINSLPQRTAESRDVILGHVTSTTHTQTDRQTLAGRSRRSDVPSHSIRRQTARQNFHSRTDANDTQTSTQTGFDQPIQILRWLDCV